MKELEIYNIQKRKLMKYVCFQYEQFEADCDKLTLERYIHFTVNPRNRFEARMETVSEQLLNGERSIPSRLCLRLENRHAICNCRIDYVFEIFDMETLREDMLWSSIFVTLMANKIGGLQFGIYRNCQISSRVFHTAVAALPLTKANRSDFE